MNQTQLKLLHVCTRSMSQTPVDDVISIKNKDQIIVEQRRDLHQPILVHAVSLRLVIMGYMDCSTLQTKNKIMFTSWLRIQHNRCVRVGVTLCKVTPFKEYLLLCKLLFHKAVQRWRSLTFFNFNQKMRCPPSQRELQDWRWILLWVLFYNYIHATSGQRSCYHQPVFSPTVWSTDQLSTSCWPMTKEYNSHIINM